MKIKDIFTTANANLFRNKVRTVLTIIAIFVGSFTITLTSALNAGVNDYINRQLGSIGGNSLVIISPKVEAQTAGPKEYDADKTTSSAAGGQGAMSGVSPLTKADIAKIEEIPNLSNVQPMQSVNTAYIAYDGGTKYEISTMPEFDGIKMDIAAGSTSVPTDEDSIFLSNEYFEPLGFESPEAAVGKTVEIAVINSATKEMKEFDAIIGAVLNESIVAGGQTELSRHLADQMIAFQNEGVPAAMTDRFMVAYGTLADGANAEDVKQAVVDAGFDAQTVSDMLGSIKSIIDAITYVLIAFAAIALLAAAFGIINTLYMSVSERTREIGLMKAMGMSSRKVFAMFSAEAILIGIWGSIVAILAALGVGGVINEVASKTFLKDLSGFTLMQYPVQNVALVAGVIILIAFLSGTLPALKASKQNPIDALRYE
jgi:putative ABC transport system permease protein